MNNRRLKIYNVKFEETEFSCLMIHRLTSILFSICTCLSLFCFSSNAQSIKYSKPNIAYFKSFVTGTEKLITSPVHWNTTQTIIAGAGLQTTLMLMQQDKNIQLWVQQHRNETTNNVSNLLKPLGNGFVLSSTCAALFIGGAISKSAPLKNFALQSLKSIAISSAAVGASKLISGKPRPYQSLNPLAWAGPFQNTENRSFFSGHATFSFSMASSINYFSRNKFWGMMAYTVATGVALSRVNNNDHWSSDVFFGACMGTAITYCLVKKN